MAKRLWRFFGGRGLGLDRVVFAEAFFGLSLLGRAVGPRIFWLACFPGPCPGLALCAPLVLRRTEV
jgi:hypothetical protein